MSKVYSWNELTSQLVTSFYLYGTPEKPADLASDQLIRDVNEDGYPRPSEDVVVNVDALGFMAVGPGRFANASQVPLVRAFMNGELVAANGKQQRIKLSDLAVKLDPNYGKAGLGKPAVDAQSLAQYNYSDRLNDCGYRTYVWNRRDPGSGLAFCL